MIYEIKHWNGRLLYTQEGDSLKAALELLVLRDADLSGADLSGADLRGAYLSDAVLSGAVLSGANLRGADLSDAVLSGANLLGANLRGANLSGADLRGAYLRGANLRGANLSDAVLSGANLSDAVLSGANLLGANLRGANLSGADLRGADLRGAYLRGGKLKGVPVVPNLHRQMLDAIAVSKNPDGGLDMSNWHTCETTHCRAGWAITLADEAGAALELGFGPAAAGALITLASCPWMEKVPDFYANNEDALADIQACAEREKAEAAQ